MVQWKITLNERKLYFNFGDTPIFHIHDCGRKGNEWNPDNFSPCFGVPVVSFRQAAKVFPKTHRCAEIHPTKKATKSQALNLHSWKIVYVTSN